MSFFSSHTILHFLLLISTTFTTTTPFTLTSDSTKPSALVDAPQLGFTINNSGARTDTTEQKAIYDIMLATGNQWATQIPDVCKNRWHGIECMPDNNNVYHIVSLSFGALSDDTAFPTCDPNTSFISKSITKLPHLRTLFFYHCFGDNPQRLPPFLGKLGQSLRTLVLRENGHVGGIPEEWKELSNLRVLDLSNNNLNGTIPYSVFNRFTSLRSLDLSGNKFSGSIPHNITFPLLTVFNLNRNLLTGSIPSSIGTSHSLIKLDLSHNHLTGRIPNAIRTLKDLILMDLSNNHLIGPIPTSINSLHNLQALILKGNQMTSTTLPDDLFNGLENLVILVLSNMDLGGGIPSSLGRLPKIRAIHLDNNAFEGLVPLSFRELRNVGELRLDNNKLYGKVPFDEDFVWKMKRKIKLGNNKGLCFDGKGSDGGDEDLVLYSGVGYCG